MQAEIVNNPRGLNAEKISSPNAISPKNFFLYAYAHIVWKSGGLIEAECSIPPQRSLFLKYRHYAAI
jgi:hypothetical protein